MHLFVPHGVLQLCFILYTGFKMYFETCMNSTMKHCSDYLYKDPRHLKSCWIIRFYTNFKSSCSRCRVIKATKILKHS